MDRLSDLPQGILQRILYFLSQKEAVRTSVLSKSWRYIWCTRPNLHLSDTFFSKHNGHQEFVLVVDKILQQYCDQRVCLEEFRLSISAPICYWHDERNVPFVCLFEKWNPLLRTMGVKEFRLSIRGSYRGFIDLPPVVFEAEPILDLHLEGFKLGKNDSERIVALCKNLNSLCLESVEIEDESFQKIISNNPSIETVCVEGCPRLRTVRLNDLHNLKSFSFEVRDYYHQQELCSIEIHPSSLIETIKIRWGNLRLHRGADFRNLKDLSLCDAEAFLDHLSSCKFPSLQFLKISNCNGLEESRLSFDAPNINRFEYRGSFVPSISFAATSREWKSDIYLETEDASSSWFLKLKELLMSLSHSEISLAIRHKNGIIQHNSPVRDHNGCNKLIYVENLRMRCESPSFQSLVNGVFGICRPRNIYCDHYRSYAIQFVAFIWKILILRESRNKDESTLELSLPGLEEASFSMKEKNEEEWDRATLSDFVVYWRLEFRFALKWRETLCESKA